VLVLTRKLNQAITVGNPLDLEEAIEIKVIEVRGDQVRLGVVAPHDVTVHRKEIWLQIQQEHREAEVPK
jgi:carbon storage regulator